MSSPLKAAALRVVSYNVLSSHLSQATHYSTYNPAHLEAATRLTKVLAKLDREITSSDDNRSTIFCLQEVSYDWAASLHTFFAQRGYHVVTGNYGSKFNGYMGVLTAYPVATLDTVSVDISRLSDTMKWPDKPPQKGGVEKLLRNFLSPPLKLLGLQKDEKESHWSIAQRRFNVLLTVALQDKATQQQFCIGNYHMPCCYYAPMVMTVHADLGLHRVQQIASTSNIPYIFTGDFNIKPVEPVYALLTTGDMAVTDPFYPKPPAHHPEYIWTPTLTEPVRSAYAVANGAEPDFTNYAKVKEDDPFIDTLDYIFVSSDITVDSVLPLPDRESADGPFPNETEPSDHVMIAANLNVQSSSSTTTTTTE